MGKGLIAPGVAVTTWGTRGSIPTPGPDFIRYGGNTACVTVAAPGSPLVVIDAGTGIAGLARSLGRPDDFRCHLLLSHLHWDHLIGLPFFFTGDNASATVDVWGPEGEHGLKAGVDSVVCPPGFPIASDGLEGRWTFHDLHDEDALLDDSEWMLTARSIRHRGPTMGFRLEGYGVTIAYLSDHGPGAEGRPVAEDETVPDAVVDLVRGADLVFHDSQHTAEQYARFRHFGHCTPGYAVRVAAAGNAARLVLFHHDPGRTDATIGLIVDEAVAAAEKLGYDGQIWPATEGEVIELASRERGSHDLGLAPAAAGDGGRRGAGNTGNAATTTGEPG